MVDISKKPDILAISKTKLKDAQQYNYNVELEGFDFLKSIDKSTTNAGGVGIYINRIYSYNLVNSYRLNVNGCEDIWVELKLGPSKNKKCVVGVIYIYIYVQTSKFQSHRKSNEH